MKTTRELHADAREALGLDLQKALLATFLAGIFTTVVQVIEQSFPTYTAVNGGMVRTTSGLASLLVVVASVAGLLFSPALSLGCAQFFIARARGGALLLRALLSCFSIRWKALGLYVMIFLRLLGWALLGVALATAAAMLLGITGMPWLLAITGLSLVPFYWAMLLYAIAPHLMADEPTLSIQDALEMSRQLMATRRVALLKLTLSFLVGYGVVFAAGYLLQGVNSVLSTLTTLALSLLLSAYMNAAIAVFYVEVVKDEKGERHAEPEAV